MNLKDFSNPAGTIIKTLEGHNAFLPNNLPPSIDVVALLTPIGESIQLLGELKGAARRTENPYILIEPLQRREALTTSAMEGTHTSIENLVLEEEGLATSKNEDVRETLNYIRALRLAIRGLEKYPISHRIICSAHSALLSGLSNERGANKRPGEYKVLYLIGLPKICERKYTGLRIAHFQEFCPTPMKFECFKFVPSY